MGPNPADTNQPEPTIDQSPATPSMPQMPPNYTPPAPQMQSPQMPPNYAMPPQQPPQMPPNYTQQPMQPVGAVAAPNPGQTLGIIGIIMSFIFLSLPGLILSIISTVKSAKAGASKTLGIIGIVLNSMAIISTIGMLALITLGAYAGIQERASINIAQTIARSVEDKADTYYSLYGAYPATIDDFAKDDKTALDPADIVTTYDPSDTNSVKYQQCSDTGAQVTYYDPSIDELVVTPLGDAPYGNDCQDDSTTGSTYYNS